MNTLYQICETLDRLTENEAARKSLEEEMDFEKEALDRAQDSLMAHLSFLRSEYLKKQKLFSRVKHIYEKQEVYEKVLTFNRVARRPLSGYLSLFKESTVRVRRRRLNKVLVV